MQLVVTIEKAPDPGLHGRAWRCGKEGGTLGRGDACDLVLPDPERFTSSVHAEIEAEEGGFRVIDRSTNGTFHNAAGKLIGKGRSAALESGDRIYIGDYVMRVEIESDAAQAGPPDAQDFDDFDDFDQDATGARPPAEKTPPKDWDPGEFSLPWEGKDSAPATHQQAFSDDEDDEHEDEGFSQSPEREYFSAPSTSEKPAEVIPDDWDSFLTGFQEPAGSESSKEQPAAESKRTEESRQEASSRPPEAPLANAFGAEDPDPADASESVPPTSEPGDDADDDLEADSGPEAESFDFEPESDAGGEQAADDVQDSSTRAAASIEPQSRPQAPPAEKEPQPEPQSPSERPQRPKPASRPHSQSEPARPAGQGKAPAESSPARSSASAGDHDLHAMLRVITEGLMALLQGRAEIKNEFRIAQTRFVQTENNPMKFSPNVDEAMTRILGTSEGSGFLTGIQAYEDALNDLQAHQLALLSAAQRAVESVIDQFDPAQLEARLQRISPLSARTPGLKAAKCWNLFTMHYDDVAGKMRDDARQMFLAEFAEAYEEACQQVLQAREKQQ